MSRNLPLSGKTHPLTGEPIVALGFRCDGRPIWPIIGAADPVRPDDVSEEEWEALGDPGKQALTRERAKVTELQGQLAAARAKPAPPKAPPAPTVAGPGTAPAAPAAPAADPAAPAAPDLAALIKDTVEAAIKPFQEREQQREAQTAAEAVRSAVVTAAKERLHDGTDGLMIDLTTVVAEDGTADAEKIGKALDALIAAKPHLAKDPRRFAAPGVGPTAGGATLPIADQVKASLARMQASTGVRLPSSGQ